MELVTPNVGTIFWMVIIFAIVAVVLKKFAWKPLLNGLYEREESIENALNAARNAREEMARLIAGNEELMAQAKKEKDAIMRDAMVLKEGIIAEAKEKATSETQKSIESARQQIQQEKQMAINEMKKQMAEISLMIAEKVIRKEMSGNKQQQEMIDNLLDEIKLN